MTGMVMWATWGEVLVAWRDAGRTRGTWTLTE